MQLEWLTANDNCAASRRVLRTQKINLTSNVKTLRRLRESVENKTYRIAIASVTSDSKDLEMSMHSLTDAEERQKVATHSHLNQMWSCKVKFVHRNDREVAI